MGGDGDEVEGIQLINQSNTSLLNFAHTIVRNNVIYENTTIFSALFTALRLCKVLIMNVFIKIKV